MRRIVISDIHGCYYTFMLLLDKVKYNQSEDMLILLGDYIDRGKHSFEVIKFLKELKTENVVILKGNHEEMMCDTINGVNDGYLWKCNGGNKTKKSYYKNKANLYLDCNWINQLPYYYEDEDFIYCHAGMPKLKLKDCTRDDLIWSRNWINTMQDKTEKRVIFGHTPSSVGVYVSLNENICIDTGCVFGYKLTAMIINNNKIKYTSISKDERD